MSNMGKILAVSPHEETEKMKRWYLYGNRENIQGRLSRANHTAAKSKRNLLHIYAS